MCLIANTLSYGDGWMEGWLFNGFRSKLNILIGSCCISCMKKSSTKNINIGLKVIVESRQSYLVLSWIKLCSNQTNLRPHGTRGSGSTQHSAVTIPPPNEMHVWGGPHGTQLSCPMQSLCQPQSCPLTMPAVALATPANGPHPLLHRARRWGNDGTKKRELCHLNNEI